MCCEEESRQKGQVTLKSAPVLWSDETKVKLLAFTLDTRTGAEPRLELWYAQSLLLSWWLPSLVPFLHVTWIDFSTHIYLWQTVFCSFWNDIIEHLHIWITCLWSCWCLFFFHGVIFDQATDLAAIQPFMQTVGDACTGTDELTDLTVHQYVTTTLS